MRTYLAKFIDLMLTTDSRQRLRLMHSGMAALLMAASVLLMHVMAGAGLSDGRWLWPWTAVSGVGLLGMFLAIRCGWALRFADPSLAVPQLLYAVGCAAVGYRINGQGQGVVLLGATLILMFGMFGLKRRQAWGVGGYAIATFGAAMWWGAVAAPTAFKPALQLSNFAMFCVFVCGFLAVSGRLSTMRSRLRAQRIELADALERISLLATHDELTGLLNRRAMGELLHSERERSMRKGHAWSLAILDIDHFKQVNDVHGHAGGDEVLRVVARAGLGTIRKCDAIARWGGEEFVLLLRDIELDGARAAVERIGAQLALLPISLGGPTFHITASIGITAHVAGEEVARTLSRADRALYQAKSSGRNRVCSQV